jgi:hypothetical protein
MNACSDNQLTRIGSTTPTNRLRDSRSCALEKEEQEEQSPQDEARVLLGFGFLVSEHLPSKQALHPQMFHNLQSVADLDSRTPKSDPAACIAVTKTCRRGQRNGMRS